MPNLIINKEDLEFSKFGDGEQFGAERAVTKEDVLDAARKYLRPEYMQTVLFDEEAFSID